MKLGFIELKIDEKVKQKWYWIVLGLTLLSILALTFFAVVTYFVLGMFDFAVGYLVYEHFVENMDNVQLHERFYFWIGLAIKPFIYYFIVSAFKTEVDYLKESLKEIKDKMKG